MRQKAEGGRESVCKLGVKEAAGQVINALNPLQPKQQESFFSRKVSSEVKLTLK